MFTYIVAIGVILLLYVLSKVIPALLVYKKELEASRHFPLHPYLHDPIWGFTRKAACYDDIYRRSLPYIEETGAKVTVMWMMFFWPHYMLTHPDSIKPVLKSTAPKSTGIGSSNQFFAPWTGDGLLASNKEKWFRNRRLLTPAFHFDILKSYVNVYNDACDILLDRLEKATQKGKSVDVFPFVGRSTLDILLRCALSYKGDIQQEGGTHPYVHAVKRMTRLICERFPIPLYYSDFIYSFTASGKEFYSLCDYVHNFADGIIKERQKSLADDPSQLNKRRRDFLDIILSAKDQNGNGLSDQEIRDEVDTFMFAGHDTTSSAISWAFHSLARYPEIQTKVREEVQAVMEDRDTVDWDDLAKLEYTTCFLKENMRMNSTVPVYVRRIDEPLEIEGVELPAGSRVQMHADLMNHNPSVWPDHMEFKPERFMTEDRDPFSFLPFSAGSRNCIGQNFALNEQKVMVAKMVKRFNLKLDPEQDAEWLPEIVMIAKNGLYVKLERRTA